MKRYSSADLARGFLVLRERTSHQEALKALAAALITGKISYRLESVVHEIQRQLLQKGTAIVEVTSAHKFSPKLQQELMRLIKKMSGANHVEAAYVVNPDLIGGFIATTPMHTIDTSVSGMLHELSLPLHM